MKLFDLECRKDAYIYWKDFAVVSTSKLAQYSTVQCSMYFMAAQFAMHMLHKM